MDKMMIDISAHSLVIIERDELKHIETEMLLV